MVTNLQNVKGQQLNICTKATTYAGTLSLSCRGWQAQSACDEKPFFGQWLSTREHVNTGNHPKHALTLGRILGILQFVKNYAEQNAILLPGRIPGFKRDDVKVLPSSDTKKVCINKYHW